MILHSARWMLVLCLAGVALPGTGACAQPAMQGRSGQPNQKARHKPRGKHSNAAGKLGQRMNANEIVAALRAHRRDALNAEMQAPEDAVPAITSALMALDAEAREMAVSFVERTRPPHDGDLLLRLAQDDESMVSVGAAMALVEARSRPPMEAILATAARQPLATARGPLYLAAGATGETSKQDRLRSARAAERDPAAARDAQAALVKLGDHAERAAYLTDLGETDPDDAVEARDRLLYLADPRLAKGLLPWFESEEPAMRIATDPHRKMARMCDLAAWTAHLLGVRFSPAPTMLDIYSAELLHHARAAIRALPE